ncbi:MAG: methanethiol S-methyltransferase [Xanthobacteraceae bacterium]
MAQTEMLVHDIRCHPAARLGAFLYGLASYGTAVLTICYAVGFVSALLVPKTIDSGVAGDPLHAAAVNLLLMALFALQHSVMARPQFKEWWTQYVHKSMERSTYVLLASLALILLFWQWRPMPTIIWQVTEPTVAASLTVLALLGWVIVLTSTFLINHFELFGLHQVTNHLRGQPMPNARFRTPFFYNFVRHPIYLGFLIAFWATPLMTTGHLLFAGVTTAYILVGIWLEERDLTAVFGDEYRRYKERVSMLLPWRRSA